MSSRKETTESERLLVVKWSKEGKSLRDIASLIGVTHGCVQKILQNDGRFKIWREAGKALAPKNTIKTVKFGGGSVLVWGCMSAGGVGELAFIKGIMDKHVYLGVLKDNLEKSASKLGLGSGFIFQQDSDPKHTAKIVQLYLLYHCRKQLHTPAQPPDLNVIENLWLQLEKAVHEHDITSKEVLKKVLREKWAKLSVETTKTLVESMPRLQAVIQAKGYATKY
ncbi:transposable element Tcb1 transposase [Trichonephila clavipes]|nr:transposable element Tcb1 transposase [Trichonephila clavipes]